MKNTYNVIGLMSGTSLDGLDLAHCYFEKKHSKWNFSIEEATTVPYDNYWKDKLRHAHNKNAYTISKLNMEYGFFLAKSVKEFIDKYSLDPNFIASHGHTVFHKPDEGLSLQIGSGESMACLLGIPVISDFRIKDVCYGGQGAPLVPIGDKILFSNYDYCLNIGGFANISHEHNKQRIAYDICPANIVLNRLVFEEFGLAYDINGKIAKQGQVKEELLKKLNSINYYHQSPPKSLGREWLEEIFLPLLKERNYTTEDKLRTIIEHIAIQITRSLKQKPSGSLLITGGGAYNNTLIKVIRSKTNIEVIIPDTKTTNYKEALIFAFMGVLRIRKEMNCMASVTGADKDTSSGIIHYP